MTILDINQILRLVIIVLMIIIFVACIKILFLDFDVICISFFYCRKLIDFPAVGDLKGHRLQYAGWSPKGHGLVRPSL